jgi:hypothetical protein
VPDEQASSSGSVEQRVSEWLTEQGYPLELRVAQAFTGAGAEVKQAEYFKDSETGKFREIDVVATFRRAAQGEPRSVFPTRVRPNTQAPS